MVFTRENGGKILSALEQIIEAGDGGNPIETVRDYFNQRLEVAKGPIAIHELFTDAKNVGLHFGVIDVKDSEIIKIGDPTYDKGKIGYRVSDAGDVVYAELSPEDFRKNFDIRLMSYEALRSMLAERRDAKY